MASGDGWVRNFRQAHAQLSAAQKNSVGTALYSKLINRPLGRVFAAGAHVVGLTPNLVTGISAVFTFAGIIVLAAVPPSWLAGVVVAVLLVLGYALDAADGQLARLRGGGSPEGEWLDHVVDAVKLASIHLAVLISLWRDEALPTTWVLLIPLAFSISQTAYFFGMLLTDLVLRETHARKHPGTAFEAPRFGTSHSTLMSLVRIPVDYGFLCALFLLRGWTDGFVIIYAVMAISMTGYAALASIRWFRMVKTAGVP